MKRNRLIYVFLSLAYASLLWVIPVHAQAGKEEWVFVGFTKYRDALYIEKKSISYPSAGIVWVWSLVAPSEKSKYREQVKEELKQLKKSARGLKYIEILNEIDCKGSRIRFLQIAYFDAGGSIIHSAASADQEWKVIYPGSLWQNIQGSVCKN